MVLVTADRCEFDETLHDLQTAIEDDREAQLSDHLAGVTGDAAAVLHVDSVGIAMMDDAHHVRTVAASGPAAQALGEARETIGDRCGLPELPEDTVVVPDLAADPRYATLEEHVRGRRVRAVISAPISSDGRVVGSLDAVQPRPIDWSPEDVAGTTAFADVVGALVEMSAGEPGARGQDGPEEDP